MTFSANLTALQQPVPSCSDDTCTATSNYPSSELTPVFLCHGSQLTLQNHLSPTLSDSTKSSQVETHFHLAEQPAHSRHWQLTGDRGVLNPTPSRRGTGACCKRSSVCQERAQTVGLCLSPSPLSSAIAKLIFASSWQSCSVRASSRCKYRVTWQRG